MRFFAVENKQKNKKKDKTPLHFRTDLIEVSDLSSHANTPSEAKGGQRNAAPRTASEQQGKKQPQVENSGQQGKKQPQAKNSGQAGKKQPQAKNSGQAGKNSKIYNGRTPSDVFDELSQYVIGQTEAKKTIAIAATNHMKRIALGDRSIKRSNIMLIGPTGCGKTHIVSSLARTLQVPFVTAPATDFTSAGFVGRDVGDVLLDLLKAANGDLARAEKGIVFIDEVDKLAKNCRETISGTDFGISVQQSFLTMLDGTKVNCLVNSFRTNKAQIIDSSGILFIFGGAFPGLYDVIRNRLRESGDAAADRYSSDELFAKATTEDLCTFGLIPEFVGRIPAVAALEKLKTKDYVRILTEPKDAIVKQYEKMFAADGVKLKFTQGALLNVAEKAEQENRGARGLRTIIENELKNAQFFAPQLRTVPNTTMLVEKGTDKQHLKVRILCPSNRINAVRALVNKQSKEMGFNFTVSERSGTD